uniref:Ig-like domain-containing protein n=1 Tax=Monodon monoceros TaxID=40151 RepID=A0A8C6F0Z2_MONMO
GQAWGWAVTKDTRSRWPPLDPNRIHCARDHHAPSPTCPCPPAECRNHTQPPRVYLLRPPLQGLWLQAQANFTCLAVGGDLQAARLSWEVAGQPQSGHTEKEPKEHTNGSWSRSSHLALSRALWVNGTPVTCTLSGPGLQSPVTLVAQKEHEALAPSKPAVRVLTTPSPLPAAEAATWLLCEVSHFSPLGVLLAWLEGQHEVDPSWSATARPAAQPGNSSFRTWSVLRIPAFPGRAAATYTCVVRHEASRTLLSASLNLDTGGESRGLGASIRAGGRRWAGGGGAAPEEPGSGDQAAARLECTPPCPGGSGCPGSCPIGPGPVSTHHVLAHEGWEVGAPTPVPEEQPSPSKVHPPLGAEQGLPWAGCEGDHPRQRPPWGHPSLPIPKDLRPSGSTVSTWEARYARKRGLG